MFKSTYNKNSSFFVLDRYLFSASKNYCIVHTLKCAVVYYSSRSIFQNFHVELTPKSI
jgi:hypothetical protein